jgi:adenine-specific DNA-methyltransferase
MPVESIDFEKLKSELGTFSDVFESRRERYGMDWPGKKDAMKIIQQSSVATLKPCQEESVNFNDTENIFIEGDNLEVLKLLQKSYYGKVKMIYIDPPYNTGKEFIYPDKYSESLDTYLAYAGLVDDEGRKFSTNTANEGRFHTKWLNMMYPRLFLARNLLKEDGVIFISIDDNEVSNLRKLCDEIFGEENFVAQLVWKKKYTGGKHTSGYVDLHEYVFVFAKSINNLAEIGIQRPDEEKDKFVEEDEFIAERGKFYVRPLKSNLELRRTLIYPIITPDGSVLETQWLVAKDTFEKLLVEKRVEFRQKRDGSYQIYRKYYEKDGEGIVKPPSLIDKYPNNEGKVELKTLFNITEGRDNLFYTVKPTGLIKHLLEPYFSDSDIIFDFFSGSATTAHAVLDLNKQDNGNRSKFILVQLPEPCDSDSEAFKAGYKTIADIGKERIRRVIKNIQEEQTAKGKTAETKLPGMAEQPQTELDLGFKVFKLDKSNFKIWDGSNIDASDEQINKQLELHIDHIDPDASQEDILYELLLKAGFMPTEKVQKIDMAGKTVFSISDGALLICLEEEITKELINTVADARPFQFICLDKGFKGNDQLKANAVQTFKAYNQGKDKAEQIVFRTV